MAVVLLTTVLVFLFWLIGQILNCHHPLKSIADVAIVFGSNEYKARPRIEKGIELYRKGLIKKLIVTGKPIMKNQLRELPTLKTKMESGEKEALWLKKKAIRGGVKPQNIIAETKSTNYQENLIYAKEIIDKYGWKRIVLISSDFESLRVYLTAKKIFGPSYQFISQPTPTQPRFWDPNTWFLSKSGLIFTWETISRLIKYKIQGDL